MEINILNEIYDAYKGCIEDASSMWKSEYCCSAKEAKQRDIEDEEDLKYFLSLLQKIDNNISNKEDRAVMESIYIVDIEVKGNTIRCYCTDDKEKVKECWGDDWDDTPYEHNAGDAYDEYYDYYVDLFFPFNYHILTPADDWHFCGNSPYCKEDFKNKYAPAAIICDDKVADEMGDWDISYSKYLGADNDHVLKLFYGDNLFKFMNKIMFFDVVDK